MKLPFEHKSQPLLSFPLFLVRMALSLGVGFGIIMASLIVGMVGHHYFMPGSIETPNTVADDFLWASMLLSGMGPIDEKNMSTAAKYFSGTYALYSGFTVLVVVGISFGPIAHRLLHKLHIDDADYASINEIPPK